jgi:hypothetical protein
MRPPLSINCVTGTNFYRGLQGFGLDLTGSEQGPVVGRCECDNEPAVSFKGRGIFVS